MEIEIRNTQRRIRISCRRIRDIARAAVKLSILKVACRGGEFPDMELGVLLVGDRRMMSLNRSYRGKNITTDVLSFPQIGEGKCCSTYAPCPLGDIVICLPQARRQAAEYGFTFYEELTRLVIHGLLHLLGHDHEKSAYKAKKMRKLEKEIFEQLCASG
jgi:probable rRNA maturation factor